MIQVIKCIKSHWIIFLILCLVLLNELLLKSFKQHSQGSSFISKIFGLFFSSFKESEFVAMLNADKQRANSLTKQVLGVDTSRPRKPVETPVQSALKILKRSGQLQKASEILYSRSDEGLKVKEILRMYWILGLLIKRISKNDKAIHEFLQELKNLFSFCFGANLPHDEFSGLGCGNGFRCLHHIHIRIIRPNPPHGQIQRNPRNPPPLRKEPLRLHKN